jgi:hypothetical protein
MIQDDSILPFSGNNAAAVNPLFASFYYTFQNKEDEFILEK